MLDMQLHKVGSCYENGKGMTKNIPKAIKYLKMAADSGDANAQTNLIRLLKKHPELQSAPSPPTFDPMTALVEATASCDTCGCACEPLRCAGCNVAKYCSQACQKVAWKRGHKIDCAKR